MMSYLQANNLAQRSKGISQRTVVAKEYPSIDVDDVKLSELGLTPAQRKKAWKKVSDHISAHKNTFLGYQVNQNVHGSEVLRDYLDLHINNFGDPFNPGYFGVHTKFMECAVLDYFAKLWNIKVPEPAEADDDGEVYWGYVVSMGCTEANLYAQYNARDYLCGWPLLRCDQPRAKQLNPSQIENGQHCSDIKTYPNAFTPVAFYSERAHYSQAKAMRVLGIKTFHEIASGNFPCPLKYPDDYPSTFCEDVLDENGWPSTVPVDADGSMHIPSLVKLVDAFVTRGYPPIVTFTTGTTFTGSYDNPQAAINELVPILKHNNLYERRVYYDPKDPTKFDVRHGFWFHVDGALGAAYLPFLEMAINHGLVGEFPVFDFRIPEVMSIAMSLQKWFGCPFPSGIYMTRKKNQLKPPTNSLYIGSSDTTLSGSRNGHGVMIMWDFLSKKSHKDLMERALRNEEMVKFALKQLKELEQEIGKDLWILHSPGSLLICFKRPRMDIVRRYSLACDNFLIKTDQGKEIRPCSHVCIMEHVDEELIKTFVEELRQPGSFPPQNTREPATHYQES